MSLTVLPPPVTDVIVEETTHLSSPEILRNGSIDFYVDNGVLKITGSGAMPDYNNRNNVPWLNNDNAKAATKLEIASGITSIGKNAFYGLNITSADIPDTVTSIGEYAFQNCNKLTTISSLTNVSSIGSEAFRNCSSLSSLETGDSLTTIGNYAFFRCSSLSSLELGDNLTSIGDCAFYGCSSLPSVLITSNSIGASAFQYCSGLSRVYFTERINTIGTYAFSNSGVKDVYYQGSQTQWNNISGHDQSPLNSANKKYNFDPSKVSSVTLDESYFYLGKGNTGTLTAVIFPETAANKNVTWEVDHNTIVEITNTEATGDGSRATLKGLENGTATVTVKTDDGNKTAECEIEVGTPVKKISFSDRRFDLGVGKTRQLQWTIEPEDAGNKDVTFRSDDESIASVDTTGLVTAKAKGKTNITVTTRDGEKRATCEVNVVENVEVTNLYLDKESVLLAPGESEELTVEVVPENATDKEVTWSVERSSIAKVEDQGNGKATVTAVAEGTTTLTVKTKNSGSYYAPSAQCTITVWKGSICLTRYGSPVESVTLGINESEQLSTDIPYGVTFDSTSWTVSDNSIASVDGEGRLTGIATGETTVVFRGKLNDRTYEASCPVYVWKGAVSISPKSQTVKLGETADLQMEEIPEFLNPALSWQVSDPSIASIDEKGVITGLALGETDITLTAVINGRSYSDYCRVKVERRKYGDDPGQAIAGAKMDMAAILNPKGLFSGKLRYLSSNKKVASVKKTGLLTPKNAGEVTISLEQNGSSVSSCTIKVDKPVLQKKVQVSVGQYGLNAFDYLSGTEYAPTEWQSSKPGVAAVNKDTGEITVLSRGSAKIIAIYGTGSNSSKKKYKFTLKVK